MLKVLINAYACSPGIGSEPGMAWNWVKNLAKLVVYHHGGGVSGEDRGGGAYLGARWQYALLL